MLESQADRPFNPDQDGDIVHSFFPNALPSPRQAVKIAENYLATTPDLQKNLISNPFYRHGEEVEVILHDDIYIDRFFEDYTRIPKPGSTREKGKTLASEFSEWKKQHEEEYYIRNDKYSLEAADLIHNLTLEKVHEYAEMKHDMYKYKYLNEKLDNTELKDVIKKKNYWNQLATIGKWALVPQKEFRPSPKK